MSTNQDHTALHNTANLAAGGNAAPNGNTNHQKLEEATRGMSHEEKATAQQAARFGYGPLAHVRTTGGGDMLPAFGGEFQPGLYKPVEGRKFANPAPLGLSAFALTTFLLSLINLNTRNLAGNNSIIISLAFGYGGLVQLLAGMWYVKNCMIELCSGLTEFTGKWLSATPLVLLLYPRMVVSGFPSPSS